MTWFSPEIILAYVLGYISGGFLCALMVFIYRKQRQPVNLIEPRFTPMKNPVYKPEQEPTDVKIKSLR